LTQVRTNGIVAGAKEETVRETTAQAAEKFGAARESLLDSYQAAKDKVVNAQAAAVEKASATAKAPKAMPTSTLGWPLPLPLCWALPSGCSFAAASAISETQDAASGAVGISNSSQRR
jgi:hypothetical protein